MKFKSQNLRSRKIRRLQASNNQEKSVLNPVVIGVLGVSSSHQEAQENIADSSSSLVPGSDEVNITPDTSIATGPSRSPRKLSRIGQEDDVDNDDDGNDINIVINWTVLATEYC